MKLQEKNRIHYTFLIDDENKLIPCDDAAQDFLQSIDANSIGEQILKLKLNCAMTMSTVMLNNISYSLNNTFPKFRTIGLAPKSEIF